VLVNHGRKLSENRNPIYDYEFWRTQYDKLKEDEGRKTTKDIRERGKEYNVTPEKLRHCGLKAKHLREKFGDNFVRAVVINQTNLHQTKREDLENTINSLK